MAREIKTVKADRHRASDYLNNAEDALWAARECNANARYTTSVMSAVHAAISAGDALGVWLRGERCASEKHEDDVEFFKRLGPGNPDFQTNAKRFSRILGYKHTSEYTGARLSEEDASSILRDLERFMAFIRPRIRPT